MKNNFVNKSQSLNYLVKLQYIAKYSEPFGYQPSEDTAVVKQYGLFKSQ